MLSEKPNYRPLMADIVGHKWLKNHANEVSTPEQAFTEMSQRKSNIQMRSIA